MTTRVGDRTLIIPIGPPERAPASSDLRAQRSDAIHPLDDPAPSTLHEEPVQAIDPDIEPFDGHAYPDELGDGPDLAFRSWLPDVRGRATSG
jgi:hypothetical protein